MTAYLTFKRSLKQLKAISFIERNGFGFGVYDYTNTANPFLLLQR